MKKVILVLWLVPLSVCSQIFENFESGDAENWIQADADCWNADTVSPLAGSFSLHHSFDNPLAGSDRIAMPLRNLIPQEGETKWSFMVRHGYDPSSSNKWAVFLMSDYGPEEMINGGLCNGYAIGVNMTGYDDTLRLWKFTQGTPLGIVSAGINWQTDIGTNKAATVKVTRSQAGEWLIDTYSDQVKVGSGSGKESELFGISWFGIDYEYTSTRDRLFWIDEISIDGIFIEDYVPVTAQPGDVIISELMPDPFPPVSLPEKEYIEILNTCGTGFNLRDWQLRSEGHAAIFPDVFLGPGEFMIICSIADTSLFSRYGRTTGLKSFPVLNDDEKWLALYDKPGRMIHSLHYSSKWNANNLKAGGGWSLEMIDTGFPFYEEGNWKESQSQSGGTPGRPNSVSRTNPDNQFTGIINAFPEDSHSVRVTFSESVDITDNSIDELMVDDEKVLSIASSGELQKEFLLQPQQLLLPGRIYRLDCPAELTDFAGNRPLRSSFQFGLAEKAVSGDIIVNEILFNPFPGEKDYIELYNRSDKTVDLSMLFLASVNDDTGDTSGVYPVSQVRRCFLPGSYAVLTTDKDALKKRYYACTDENIFEVAQLPSMADDEGHLLLLNRQVEVIDNVRYNEDMHFSLLTSTEGISLERIGPDLNSWHSASETSGWGTPGCRNSVFTDKPSTTSSVSLSSTRITPDNDGNDDILVINLNFPENGKVVEIVIFDEYGIQVRSLALNLLAGIDNNVAWDATCDDGSFVRTGIYIVYISVFDEKGTRESWKKVCTVLR